MADLITFKGETNNISDWSYILQIPYHVLKHRLNKGWTHEEAFETPTENSDDDQLIEFQGEERRLTKWCKTLNLEYKEVYKLIKAGEPFESAIERVPNNLIKYNGEKRTLRQWSCTLNIPLPTLRQRLEMCWTIDQALGTPIRKKNTEDTAQEAPTQEEMNEFIMRNKKQLEILEKLEKLEKQKLEKLEKLEQQILERKTRNEKLEQQKLERKTRNEILEQQKIDRYYLSIVRSSVDHYIKSTVYKKSTQGLNKYDIPGRLKYLLENEPHRYEALKDSEKTIKDIQINKYLAHYIFKTELRKVFTDEKSLANTLSEERTLGQWCEILHLDFLDLISLVQKSKLNSYDRQKEIYEILLY